MKKMIPMMLMLCAAVTFSACKKDEGPTNPVSNPNVPASAKIGSEVTVQGSGFAAGQTLWLRPEAGEEVNTNAKMSAGGATFTIPYTMSTGLVKVILQTGSDEWLLGSMTLLDADNPITAPSLPGDVALGKEVVISGIGFVEGDMISLGAISKADVSAIPTTLTEDGLKFTLPADLAEGEYKVSLVRGKYSWELGQIVAYQSRLMESITISENMFLSMLGDQLGIEDGVLTINFAYNEDGSLKELTSNSEMLNWPFTYEGKTVSTNGNFEFAKYTYTLDDTGRIVGSTGLLYGVEMTYVWSYDADGHLVSIKTDDEEMAPLANVVTTYTDGNMSEYTMGETNGLKTDKLVATCPKTVEPGYLVNSFSWLMLREDIFLGMLLNRNVNISTYVPSEFLAADADENGDMTQKSVPIEKSFENNVLTLKTTGVVLSYAQALYTSTVVVNYKNN